MNDKIAQLAAKISPQHRQRVLQKLREQKTENKKHQLPEIVPVSRDKDIPLSFAQQQLWLVDQIEGGSPHYNEFMALEIKDFFNIIALEQALTEIVKRHEIFRTIFQKKNELPIQIILPSVPVSLPVINLQGLPIAELDAAVHNLSAKEEQQPFDLAKGPLFRFKLLQLDRESYILFITIHHIIFDGWSSGILIKEMATLYEAFAKGLPSPLLPLSIQYADFADWQRQWLSKDVVQLQLKYWQQQLANIPPLLELATDKPRPQVQTFQGKIQSFNIRPEILECTQKLSQQSRTSLFMVMFATFVTLLYRYSGQEDIVVGSPIANRNHPALESLIGYFVNMLALRTKLSNTLSFTDLLAQVKETVLNAYANQSIPFEQLVENLNPERSLSYHPLFQIVFAFQNLPGDADIQWSLIETHSKVAARFDLIVEMVESPGNLTCYLRYNTDLFEPDTINRLIGHYQTLLDAVATNANRSISELPLLTEAEKQQLLALNQNQTDYPKDITIIDLFQTQVEKTPDNIAVVFGNQQLNYKDLNKKANQLAHYLMNLGIGAETFVGICVERSLEMVIGLLGIFKAGGVYVPLDPDYPQERLQFILKDSSVAVLLIQSHLLEKQENGVKIVCLDREWEQIATYPDDNPIRQSSPEDLAYVIYTSGSTGVPKGVMIEHTAITQHIYNIIIRYQIESRDKVLQFTSLNFDPSIEQILSTLCGGAQLILITSNLLPPEDIQDIIYNEKITIANFPPAYWEQIIKDIESLRLLILGGDILSSKLAQQTRQTLSSDITILNAYGPTEATITTSLFEVTEQFKDKGKKITPIGKPIANTQIYILDENYNPTPLGIPGELCIGGIRLSRGYLNHPELTAEKFTEIEIFGKPQRIYKTGDLARLLPDGNIEFIGRIDYQVKIRGFRIELEEIEANLSQHEAIKEAVVIIYNKEDNPQLVAYVTVGSEQSKSDDYSLVTKLSDWLKTRLPEYMLPTSITVLDKLPLMPNGKIDRKALQAPEVTRIKNNATFIKPQTQIEKQIAELWQKVLKVEQVSIDDNFFKLGGHSLSGTQLVSKLYEAFRIRVPMNILFETPTVANIAKYIENTQATMQNLTTLSNEDNVKRVEEEI